MSAVLAAAIGILLALPAYTAPVVDEAKRVPDDVERSVGAALADYERRSSNEIAVAVVGTTGDQSLEDYTIDLYRKWKPGAPGRDNGVVYLIALDDRRVRIEVGNDLEGELTDLESGRIIRERVVPLLRDGDVGGAVEQGTAAIREALGDDQVGALPPPPDPDAEPDDGSPGLGLLWPLLLVGLFAANRFGRRGRRGWGGGVPIFWGGGGFGGGGFGGGGGGGWSGGGGGGGASGGGASGGW